MTRKPRAPNAAVPEQGDLFAADAPLAPSAAPPVPAESPVAINRRAVLATLAEWAERGWLRRLDAAFARFLDRVDADADVEPVALLAAALVANVEGRGHVCLALGDAWRDPERALGWSPDATAALVALQAALAPARADDVVVALARSPVVDAQDVGADPRDDHGNRPLVLRDGRLYLRRHWDHERHVAAEVVRRAAADRPVDATAARRWIDRLFPSRTAALADASPDWQRVACAVALRSRFAVITGGPGTGKTWTAARLLLLLVALARAGERDGAASRPLRLALAAPTGKAAARLRQSIDAALAALRDSLGDAPEVAALAASLGAAKTLHALLGARPDTRRFRHDRTAPLPLDVLVVDEASMVDLETMAALLDALPADARLVLLGDKDQLASVEAGAVLGELCRDAERGRYTPSTAAAVEAIAGVRLPDALCDPAGPPLAQRTTVLRAGVRFGGAIDAFARAVNAGDAAAVLAALPADAAGAVCRWPSPSPAAVVALAVDGRPGAPGGYRSYLDAIADRPPPDADATSVAAWARTVLAAFDRVRVLCAVRDGPWGVVAIGRAIEARLREDGRLASSGEWVEGRPVLVTRNDRALGVANGDIGIVLRATVGPAGPAPSLRVWFVDGEGVRSVSIGRLADVETAFAMTVHKAQGSEFAHTVLVLPGDASPVATRELVYTGATRAREALTLVAPDDRAIVDAVGRTARRSSGLAELVGVVGRFGAGEA